MVFVGVEPRNATAGGVSGTAAGRRGDGGERTWDGCGDGGERTWDGGERTWGATETVGGRTWGATETVGGRTWRDGG